MFMFDDVFREWRAADQAARSAEKAAFDEAMLGRCEAPSFEKTEQIRSLRTRANNLFDLAMARMSELAGVDYQNNPAGSASRSQE